MNITGMKKDINTYVYLTWGHLPRNTPGDDNDDNDDTGDDTQDESTMMHECDGVDDDEMIRRWFQLDGSFESSLDSFSKHWFSVWEKKIPGSKYFVIFKKMSPSFNK